MNVNPSKYEVEETLLNLVQEERGCLVKILRYVAWAHKLKLHIFRGYPTLTDYLSKTLKLSRDQAAKRVQAALLIDCFPELLALLEEGKTNITNLAMLAPHYTAANSAKIMAILPGLSKRELARELGKIAPDGSERNVELTVEITITCDAEVLELLERAQSLLGRNKRGGVCRAAVLKEALDALLDKKDPVRKAARAEKKRQEREGETGHSRDAAPASEEVRRRTSEPGKSVEEPAHSRYIPRGLRHKVIYRAGGRCEFVERSGERCPRTTRLELDHKQMFCRGGDHAEDNLRVLCEGHNRMLSLQQLGSFFEQGQQFAECR